MPRPSFRGSIAFASALTLGAGVLVVGGMPATASLPGSGSVLTSSNGQKSIRFSGDPSRTSLTSSDTVTGASWSPDGSQAVYLDQHGGLRRLRFDDGSARYVELSPPDGAGVRTSPSWWGDSRIVFTDKASPSRPSRVAWAASGGALRYGWVSPNDGKHYTNPDGGPGSLVVFQRQNDDGSGQPTGQPAVMVYDGSIQVGSTRMVDDNGSNPSISPDGSRVAFVRDGRIVVSDLAGQNEVTVTPAGTQYDHPTWSPNGRTLAFSKVTATAARPVFAASADGSAGLVSVSDLDGVPAFQPRRKDQVVRLSGASRFATATAVSQAQWATAGAGPDTRESASAVVLSRSDTYADALSGAALAAAKRGPLLLTPPTGLDPTIQAELQRVLLPDHGTVYLLGSPGALSTTVENQVRALGYRVQRLAGPDRFSTSVQIAKAINPTPSTVLLATGMNYPDALAAGAAAGSYNRIDSGFSAVVLLTLDEVIPPGTKAFLDTLPKDVLMLYGIGKQGGTAAYSYDPVGPGVRGVWGSTRYETAYLTAVEFFEGQRYTGFATGTNWPDALTGGALMGTLGGPLMLTPGTDANLGADAVSLLRETSGSVHTGLVFGSPAVVTSAQQTQVGTALGGPLGAVPVSNPTDLEPSSSR
ncbi:cell wall-binding repeat-containing protein [Micromonospora sp. NPDC023956]|uniref:cell wall-binding repeat-containing protein n=1 Tax=Micromonospora sp. NPDC023956 TaxID=3155722 RepID=UPI0033E7D342